MGNKLNDIDRMYRDITASCMDSDDCEMDKSIVLRQIAYNIAHLADEVRALRHGIESIDIEVEQETEDDEEPEETKNGTCRCFICGKKMNTRDAAVSAFIDGEFRYICKECDGKIDNFISDMLTQDARD